MNILYDYQIFQSQKTGGISRYHADLYHGLSSKGINCNIGIKYSDNIYLKDCNISTDKPFHGWEHFLTHRYFKGKGTLAYWYSLLKPLKGSTELNREYIRSLLKKQKVDIFHPTYYDDIYDGIELPPMVLTIHDMIFESFPQYFNNLDVIINKYKLVQKANRIIAISQYTKNELLKYYDFLPAESIDVVYHGIDLDIKFGIEKKKNINPYLLFVGNRGGYKNFYFLVEAMKKIHTQYKTLKLICVGPPFSDSEKKYLQFMHLDDVIIYYGRVDDITLASLYTNATMYVSSSLSEGFGLPLLEAMKYGTPMLLSDIPVYKEIAKDSAIYFAPNSIDDFSMALHIIFEDSQKRFEIINNGSKNVQTFTKDKMLENTYDVYKKTYQK